VPRRGRDLETLVALVERLLEEMPVVIQSPEYIIGRRSDSPREIDVTIRGTVGSATVLVMVECRDRDGTQGVGWIDQVVGKREDVGADKAVVVCSAGFSEPAIRAAQAVGIELRTMTQLSESDLLPWVDPSFMSVDVDLRKSHLVGCNLILDNDRPLPTNPNVGEIRRTRDQESVSVLDLWGHNDPEEAWEGLAVDERRQRQIRLNFTNPEDRYEVDVAGTWLPVEAVQFVVELWIEREQVPIKQFRYSDDEEVLADGFSFDFEHPEQGGQTVAIGRNVEPDGSIVMGVVQRPRDGDAATRIET
jgi:hypothetical protein